MMPARMQRARSNGYGWLLLTAAVLSPNLATAAEAKPTDAPFEADAGPALISTALEKPPEAKIVPTAGTAEIPGGGARLQAVAVPKNSEAAPATPPAAPPHARSPG